MTPAEAAREFLHRWLDDRRVGQVRTLEEYQALWPGFEGVVAEEFWRVEDSGGTLDGSAGSDDRLGPYKLGKELGRGGQAVVYLAEDTRLGRLVALMGPGYQDQTLRLAERGHTFESSRASAGHSKTRSGEWAALVPPRVRPREFEPGTPF